MFKIFSKVKISAVFIFLLFFAIFLVIVKVGEYGNWLPSICVLIYGLFLFLLQNQKKTILLEQEKDSPYFMGFMLTLVALLYVFVSNGKNVGTNNFQPLFESIGIAISTTIVGLFCRYLIVITDKNEMKEKKLLQIFADQQEKILLNYMNAQDNLLILISSFSENHQKIIEKEIIYHNKYIEKTNNFNNELDKSYDLLMRSYAEKVEKIDTNSSNFGVALSNFYNILKENSNKIIEIQNSFEKNLENHFEEINSNELKDAVKELRESIINTNNEYNSMFQNLKDKIESSNIGESLNQIFSSIQEINSETIATIQDQNKLSKSLFDDLEIQMRKSIESIKEKFENISKDEDNLENILSRAETKIEDTINNISGKINDSIKINNLELNKQLQENLLKFQEQFNILSGNVNSFGVLLKTKGNDVEVSIDDIIDKMKNGIINTDNDLKMIDKLLTDFIEIMQKKHLK